jgi:Ku C terminal domain like
MEHALAPPRVAAKKEAALVEDRENAPLLLGPAPAVPKQLAPPIASSPSKPAPTRKRDYDSDKTEDEDDEPTPPPNATPSPKHVQSSPRHIKSSPTKGDVDLSSLAPGPSPGRVFKEDADVKPEFTIGLEHPLEDFKAILKGGRGDVVSDAVSQLAEVIKELVVAKQFPNRRKAELLEAMKYLRSICVEVRNCLLDSAHELILCATLGGRDCCMERVRGDMLCKNAL